MIKPLTIVQNPRYEDSSEIESNDGNDDHVMNENHIARTECPHKVSFFERRKGPRHERQTVIKPSNPAFDRSINYRYYRLMITRHVCLADESKKLREQLKAFQATFEKTWFSGENPILVFKFLTTFVEEAKTFGVSDAHEVLIMSKLLNSRA